MESNEYWRNRALKLEARANEKSEALQKKLKREYTKAAKEIRQKVDSFYLRYANEQGLSYSEAVKALSSKEAREWRKTIGEYVDEIKALPDGALKSRLIAELDMRSYASQQDRLSELASQIDIEIDRLFIGAEQQMSATMTDILEDGYYRKSFDLQQRTGVLTQIPRLSPEFVENTLTYPWSGADFSTRLWNNKRALLFSMRQTLTQGAIQGQSIAKMSKNLADTMGKSYIVAERLIRTEANHFHSEADRGAYEAAGVEQYEFMATLDNRVSEVCAGLDGKIFDVKDAQTGVNYPPMHPWCRSTTVEHDPEAAADGEPMPDDMSFEDWEEWQDNVIEEDSPRKPTKGEYGVNWTAVHSEAYNAKIRKITSNDKAVTAIETRAKWALNNRDGKNTEELYAIDLNLGKEIARITNQSNEYGVARVPSFDNGVIEAAKKGAKVLLLHNHPRSLPPSISDINNLFGVPNALGITIGHDGSIYLYSAPKEKIPMRDYAIALRKNKEYTEITAIEKALNELSKVFGFRMELL